MNLVFQTPSQSSDTEENRKWRLQARRLDVQQLDGADLQSGDPELGRNASA